MRCPCLLGAILFGCEVVSALRISGSVRCGVLLQCSATEAYRKHRHNAWFRLNLKAVRTVIGLPQQPNYAVQHVLDLDNLFYCHNTCNTCDICRGGAGNQVLDTMMDLALILNTYIIYTFYNVLTAFERKLRTQKGVVGVMLGIPRPACETFFENFFLGVFSPYRR
jgi:hypothetical protein